MAESKNHIELKNKLKVKTDKLVSKDKELFANLSKEEVTKEKKRRAKDFREENRDILDKIQGQSNGINNKNNIIEKENITEYSLNDLDKQDKVLFSYDKEKADNADHVLLYRDNEGYQNLLSKLREKNSVLDKNGGKNKKIYVVSISPDAKGVQNTDELQDFIKTYQPLTDYTLSYWSGVDTERINYVDGSNQLYDSLNFLNELCKKNNIKKIYLFIGHFSYDDGGKLNRSTYHYLMEHGGLYKEDGKYIPLDKSDFEVFGEGKGSNFRPKDIQDENESMKIVNNQIQLRKDFMPDVEVETFRGRVNDSFYPYFKREEGGKKNYDEAFDKKVDINNSLFFVDGHAPKFSRVIEEKGGKVLGSETYNLYGGSFEKTFPQNAELINKFLEKQGSSESEMRLYKKLGFEE